MYLKFGDTLLEFRGTKKCFGTLVENHWSRRKRTCLAYPGSIHSCDGFFLNLQVVVFTFGFRGCY